MATPCLSISATRFLRSSSLHEESALPSPLRRFSAIICARFSNAEPFDESTGGRDGCPLADGWPPADGWLVRITVGAAGAAGAGRTVGAGATGAERAGGAEE